MAAGELDAQMEADLNELEYQSDVQQVATSYMQQSAVQATIEEIEQRTKQQGTMTPEQQQQMWKGA